MEFLKRLRKKEYAIKIKDFDSSFGDIIANLFVKIKKMLHTPKGLSLFFNICTYLVLNLIAYGRYEYNTDVMMQALLSNVTDTAPTSHVAFSNMFLMRIIKGLIKFAPSVAWYTWFVVLLAFISICVLNYLILCDNYGRIKQITTVVFNIFVGYECYMYPSYMKSAIICAFAMIAAAIHIYRKNKDILYYLIPSIGLFIAGLLSIKGMLIGLICGLIISAVQLFINREYDRRLIAPAIAIVASFLVVLVFYAADRYVYTKDGDEGELILEYRGDIEKLTVFGYPKYSERFDEELGINANQYNYMYSGDEYLVKNRSKESLSFLKVLADEKISFSGEHLLEFFRTVPIRTIKVGYLYLLIIAIYTFNIGKDKKKKEIIITLSIIYILISYGVLYFNYAWDNRVAQMIAFLPVIFWILSNSDDGIEISAKEYVIYLMVLGVVLYNNFSNHIVTTKPNRTIGEWIEATVREDKTEVLNINAMLKNYSIYTPYDAKITVDDRIITMNGNCCIFPQYNLVQYFDCVPGTVLYLGDGELNLDNYKIIE